MVTTCINAKWSPPNRMIMKATLILGSHMRILFYHVRHGDPLNISPCYLYFYQENLVHSHTRSRSMKVAFLFYLKLRMMQALLKLLSYLGIILSCYGVRI